MAFTATKALPYGTSLPTDKNAGVFLEGGNLLVIGAEVAAGTGDCNLYRWWPEVNRYRLYSSNPMTIVSGQLTGKYAADYNASGYYFLLVPNGVTLTDPLIFGGMTSR